MDYINSPLLIFITAPPGAGGHRLGRIVCGLQNVHWYRCRGNGRWPWSLFYSSSVKGREVSRYHYDRRTPQGMIPLLGERIERYWDTQDLDHYYQQIWTGLMDQAGAEQILSQGQRLTWVLHDLPEPLLARFPKAQVINLVTDPGDVDALVERYLQTTALFPCWLDRQDCRPSYHTAWSGALAGLQDLNPRPTERDFWAWQNHGQPVFQSSMIADYGRDLRRWLGQHVEQRHRCQPGWINVAWRDLDVGWLAARLGLPGIKHAGGLARLLDVKGGEL